VARFLGGVGIRYVVARLRTKDCENYPKMTGPIANPDPEKYTHGHHASVVAAHSVRRASGAAAFVLPQLKSPMGLLE
jgi:hypothetical protein